MEALNLLNRRIERLNKEIKNNAPTIIIKYELELVQDAINKLVEAYGKFEDCINNKINEETEDLLDVGTK